MDWICGMVVLGSYWLRVQLFPVLDCFRNGGGRDVILFRSLCLLNVMISDFGVFFVEFLKWIIFYACHSRFSDYVLKHFYLVITISSSILFINPLVLNSTNFWIYCLDLLFPQFFSQLGKHALHVTLLLVCLYIYIYGNLVCDARYICIVTLYVMLRWRQKGNARYGLSFLPFGLIEIISIKMWPELFLNVFVISISVAVS